MHTLYLSLKCKPRTLLVLGIILAALFQLIVLLAPTALANSNAPAQFVRQQKSTKIFAIIDGTRVIVPRKYVIKKGHNLRNIPVLTHQALQKIPQTRFVKTADSSEIYAVTFMTRRPIFEPVEKLVKNVVTIPDEQLDAYRLVPAQNIIVKNEIGHDIQLKKGELVELPLSQNDFADCGSGFKFNNNAHFAKCDTFWDGTNLITFVLPPTVAKNYQIIAVDINDNDQIVGNMQPKDSTESSFGSPHAEPRGFIWEKGVFTILPQITSEYRIVGISDDGTIWSNHLGKKFVGPVGIDFKTDEGAGLFSLKDGLMKEHIRTRTKTGGSFNKVNNVGDAIGQEIDFTNNAYSTNKEFVLKDGTFTTFGTNEMDYVSLSDINDAKQVVGYSSNGAFVWQNGTSQLLPGKDTTLLDINNFGIAIGEASLKTSKSEVLQRTQAVWKDDRLIDFEKLFPPQFRVDTYGYAYALLAINDLGQILGKMPNTQKLFIATLPDMIELQGENTANQ